MMRITLALITATLAATVATAQNPNPTVAALLARAKAVELNTPYVPPPGDPLELNTAGYAKIMCSAVFITGLDPDFAAQNVGYFTSPYNQRALVGKPVIDRVNKEVTSPSPTESRARQSIWAAKDASLCRPVKAP